MLRLVALFAVFLLLLIGGQSLMETVHAQRLVADLRGVSVAVLLYQDRYGHLPGDDPRAHERFPALGPGESGNGNRRIEGAWNSPRLTDESRLAWLHLRLANLHGGCESPTSAECRALPTSVGGLRLGVQSAPLPGIDWRGDALLVCLQDLSPAVTLRAATSLDDGSLATGDFRLAAGPGAAASEATACYRLR